MLTDRLDISPEVSAALAAGRPVVALESTLISHGLPYPQNLEVAHASEAAVRASDGVPATVAVNAGRLLVGLDEASLLALATAPAGSVRKAARPSLAAALASRRVGGHDRLGDDDRRARRRDPRLRDRRDRRGPSRCARRWHRRCRPRCPTRWTAQLRYLVGSRGAGTDPDGRRLRRSQGHPRRPGHARVPRDARRARGRRRPAGAARVLRPIGRHRRPVQRRGRRARPRTSSRRTSRSGSAAGSWSASRCLPARPCPTTWRGPPWSARSRRPPRRGSAALRSRPGCSPGSRS